MPVARFIAILEADPAPHENDDAQEGESCPDLLVLYGCGVRTVRPLRPNPTCASESRDLFGTFDGRMTPVGLFAEHVQQTW